MSNFIKIRPVVVDMFYAVRQTDGHYVANSRFSEFCKRARKTVPHALRPKKSTTDGRTHYTFCIRFTEIDWAVSFVCSLE